VEIPKIHLRQLHPTQYQQIIPVCVSSGIPDLLVCHLKQTFEAILLAKQYILHSEKTQLFRKYVSVFKVMVVSEEDIEVFIGGRILPFLLLSTMPSIYKRAEDDCSLY